MSLIQKGYLGRTGPVFVDDSSAGGGKYIILVGKVVDGVMKLQAVQPAFASNLNGFPYTPSQCSLGAYSDLQIVGNAPSYTQPASGPAFDNYFNVDSTWVAATSSTGNTSTTSNTTTTDTSNSAQTGVTYVTNSTGTTATTGTTTTTTFSAPTILEQITTFLSNYWWLVLIVVAALLWKPFLGPALGFGKKKRSYR